MAAGQGQRLLPLTADRPKCMVMYQGKPLIEHILGACKACGISDIVVVGGHKAHWLDNYPTRVIINPDFSSTNMVYTLFCAADVLEGDVIVSYSDIAYSPNVLASLISCPADFAVVIDKEWRGLWQARMDDPLQDAETLKLNAHGQILELGKKAKSYSEIEGQYIGLFKISAKTITKFKSFYYALDKSQLYDGKPFNQMYMTSFIQLLIDSGMLVQAVPIHGGWIELDSVADLHIQVSLA